jgi:S1-C subfamily serine protease
MKLPAWLAGIRAQGILAGTTIFLVVVLYSIVHHPQELLGKPGDLHLNASAAAILSDARELNASSTSSLSTSTVTTSTTTLSSVSKNLPPTKTLLGSAPESAASTVIPAQELDASGGQLLKSLVNIVCVSSDPSIPSISGSGVIIDSRGIILTAAHVAQLFLLQDYLGTNKVACIVRDGSPARRAYLAEPIYVSPLWIQQNPDTLTMKSPVGTGENDFALLGITATATSTPLPASYPSVPLGDGDPQLQEPVALGSYGAQYLSASEINYALYPILVFGSIHDRYTFGTTTVDLVSVVGSAASQEGSSGGGIVNSQGQLLGTITTSSISGDLQSRTLNVITVDHIRRSYTKDTGENFDAVLQSESVYELVAGFANESKNLGSLLAADIHSSNK